MTQSPVAARRDILKCMAWAGAGIAWTMVGGVAKSALIGSAQAADLPGGGLHFAQISDTHFGFNKDANPDVPGTARQAIAKITGLAQRPAFVLHTGDISHLSKASEFDMAQQAFGEFNGLDLFTTPGEHDVLDEVPGTLYRQRFAPQAVGDGWYSFDHSGVHFISLVNVLDFGTLGLGQLGTAQLAWLEADVKDLSASTPIILFTHIPLWTIYQAWGWGTADAEQALSLLKRFGSVTVLNGHIHQVIQKVEGNVAFYTAQSTAYPQPAPGQAPSPGPLKLPADRLGAALGIRSLDVVAVNQPLAIVGQTLSGA